MVCRENFNVWRYVRTRNWRSAKKLLFWRIWKNKYARRYLLHDSFVKYINRYLMCRLFGHQDPSWLKDGGCSENKPHWYCFSCESIISYDDTR